MKKRKLTNFLLPIARKNIIMVAGTPLCRNRRSNGTNEAKEYDTQRRR